MKKVFALSAAFAGGAAFALLALAGSALSADEAGKTDKAKAACLQNDRAWGFNVIDTRTVVVSDRQNNRFTVHLTGGCVGLSNVATDIALVGKTGLGCLSQGDRLSFREPTLGRMSCIVTGVDAGVPKPKTQTD